jgi:hypothetical protein
VAKTIDSERLNTELPRMQRWEDEGGQTIEDTGSSPAPMHARRRVTSLRWNEKFMIEPFLPGSGMIRLSEKHATRTNP